MYYTYIICAIYYWPVYSVCHLSLHQPCYEALPSLSLPSCTILVSSIFLYTIYSLLIWTLSRLLHFLWDLIQRNTDIYVTAKSRRAGFNTDALNTYVQWVTWPHHCSICAAPVSLKVLSSQEAHFQAGACVTGLSCDLNCPHPVLQLSLPHSLYSSDWSWRKEKRFEACPVCPDIKRCLAQWKVVEESRGPDWRFNSVSVGLLSLWPFTLPLPGSQRALVYRMWEEWQSLGLSRSTPC